MIVAWIVFGVLGYVFMGFLFYNILKSKGVGVYEYQYSSDDTAGTTAMSVFWPITMPIYLMYVLAKYISKLVRVR